MIVYYNRKKPKKQVIFVILSKNKPRREGEAYEVRDHWRD